ncbi:MAG TPA: metalloenzyme domain-containing protein [Promineifilum sp.]|nr:metalloenzyme domain-containing protein [Promineifilum sp.]
MPGQVTTPDRAHVHIFFMDGVGLGAADPAENPFAAARLLNLTALLGAEWFVGGRGPVAAARATLVPTDATLGLPGRPQSATGQATILTGRNVPALVGEHYGPKPNAAVANIVRQGTLFSEVAAAGGRAALLTPYPERYFEAINSGRRLLSAVPLAAASAGLPLLGVDDLRAGRAVSPDFTGAGWRDFLGYADVAVLSPEDAGQRIAALAAAHDFSFFEHWPTDQVGHRGSLAEAVAHLESMDAALGGLLDAWDDAHSLLILTSDHGNLEEKSHRQHTRNAVPTILVGRDHAAHAATIHDLTDIAAVVRRVLGLPTPNY